MFTALNKFTIDSKHNVTRENTVVCNHAKKDPTAFTIAIDMDHLERYAKVTDVRQRLPTEKFKIEVLSGLGLKLADSTVIYVNDPDEFKRNFEKSPKETMGVAVVKYAPKKNLSPLGIGKESVVCTQFEIQVTRGQRVKEGNVNTRLHCAEHCSQKDCQQRGQCTWIQANKLANRNYSTCTNSPETCPNQKCEEMELLTNSCPQDCKAPKSGKGISNVS